ncbi:MAG: phosphatidate cytidylyltransferase [Prevotella sp.]|nr:phosphatidate cytidylyltransferase [Prevotella sp.]MBR4651331.1 phosphatidate cytidylyltransferase [Prevotella sp.]
MNNFIVRTITGVLFVAAVIVCFLRPTAMIAFFALVTGLSIWEFTGLVNERDNEVTVNRFICTAAGVFFFLAVAGFCGELTPSSVFIPYLLTVVYMFCAGLFTRNADPVNDWAYSMMSQMYIALPLSCINVLAFRASLEGVTYNFLLPLSIFVFLWMNDTGAYCTGSLLGKHKLFPRVSPGKSWEGSIGGAIIVVLVSLALSWVDSNHVLESLGATETGLSQMEWVGLGLVVVVFGTLGDLVESLFKRTLGIKDSGHILPGHGGMLDRFDSSLMAIPASVIYLYTLTAV